MGRTLQPVAMAEATDWSGQILPRQMTQYLRPGCVVRIAVENLEKGGSEAIYFEITKIKDGTYWGNARDTYRLFDIVGLAEGEQMTFRKQHINEIPIGWQPKQFQKAVAHLNLKQEGYFLTGLR
ncbi:MAG: hypothetical protein M1827_000304 [Pycnora praestabilis]|nr:MAG: hypothetical protein M1827_000304 [Pycnora praestabilis]